MVVAFRYCSVWKEVPSSSFSTELNLSTLQDRAEAETLSMRYDAYKVNDASWKHKTIKYCAPLKTSFYSHGDWISFPAFCSPLNGEEIDASCRALIWDGPSQDVFHFLFSQLWKLIYERIQYFVNLKSVLYYWKSYNFQIVAIGCIFNHISFVNIIV